MVASAAIATGLFVLAGVVVGGLVTGAVNYALERRRDRANARVAVRLLWAELLLAAASVDWRLEQDAWSPWSFESAHRAWNEHHAELARAVSMADFADVTVGFAAVGRAEATFAYKPVAARLDADDRQALTDASKSLHDAASALQRRQGLKEIDWNLARRAGPSGEPKRPGANRVSGGEP